MDTEETRKRYNKSVRLIYDLLEDYTIFEVYGILETVKAMANKAVWFKQINKESTDAKRPTESAACSCRENKEETRES